jgi:hypothetical protein
MATEIQVASDRPSLVDRLRSAWQGWYDPSTPIPPVAPAGTPPRQFDYPLVLNQTWLPRAGEKVGFHQLRMMADGCYLIRAIIDKVIARIITKNWHFRLKPQAGEYMAQTKDRSNKDPRIEALTNFFQMPDSTHSFPVWLGMLLEDRLVIDAACLEVQRTRGGDIFNLMPVDGATINVLIDNTGRRPMYPLPSYRQIVKGLPAIDFTTRDLIYMPGKVRNHKLYGYSAVEQTLGIILTLIYKTVMHQDWYDESNIPLAYMTMPDNMSTTEILRLIREIQASNNGNLAERVKILPVPNGGKVELLKKEEFQPKFEEWCARIFAYVMGETATPFVQQNNRATAQQSDDTREESGEKPLTFWVKNEIDQIVQRRDLFNAPDIEFVYDEEAETDALKQAQVDKINVAIGTRVADELRQRDGLSPLWEASGGNPPQPSMMVATEEQQDEPGDGGDDQGGGKPKPKKDGKKVSKAADAQKKTLLRY